MTDEQFALLIEKLDWIGYTLDRIDERQVQAQNFPMQVEIASRRGSGLRY